MEKLSYCFAGWHCWNGVNKTKDNEQSTVERHGKEVGRVGGGPLTRVESDAFSFRRVVFYRMREAL